MDSQNTVRLRVPKQDLISLTFDAAVPKKMNAWVGSLPKVNVGESSRQLYSAIQELNRFKTDPKNRFLLLEELRSSIHYVCKSLGKHFLNQSIVLNDKESKVANLAQALQNHLAIGYKIVLLETLQLKTAEAAKLRALATHRALTELSGNLLRCFQLYFPPPTGLWQEIHQLYSLADYYGILAERVQDDATRSNLSIEQCYFKTMLLSTARPNQLRQNEIAQLAAAFNIWAEFCEFKKDENSPFVVDLKSDQGALYSQWNKDHLDTTSTNIRYVHLSRLVNIVNSRIINPDQVEGVGLDIKMLAPSLLRHLVQSWSASSQRAFARTQTGGKISLAFGLGAVHHFISNGQDFGKMLMGGNELLVLQDDDNPFLSTSGNRNYGFSDEIRSGGDVWSLNAVASTAKATPSQKDLIRVKAHNVFPAYQCDMIDTSPGGYCLQWNGAAPPQLKTGEIICIKEAEQENWSVGAVRWMKKVSSTSVRLGLELLAPHAEAVGAKVIHRDGATTEYMRAIRLPELKSIQQASTLITPQLTFKTGYKVLLNVGGEELRLQLLKEVGATASFSQFEYKLLGEKLKSAESDISIDDESEFNSLWTSI